jgi:hypothetical protein
MARGNFRAYEGLEIIGDVVTTQVLNGDSDPSQGGGVPAEVGSLLSRNAAGTDGGELYLKFGEDAVDWIKVADSSGGTPSGEDGFQNTFMGKTGTGSETPTYSTNNQVADAQSLETAIGVLDGAIGADSTLTPLIRTVGQLVNTEDLKQHIEDLDTVVGADASLTPVSRTTGTVSISQDIYTNIDDLDAAIGADVTPVTRTNNPIVVANSSNANIDALDSTIGADADLTVLTRTVGQLTLNSTVYAKFDLLDTVVGADASLTPESRTVGTVSISQDIYTNIDDLDAAIGADVTSTNVISTSNSVNANLSALDAVAPIVITDTNITTATTVDTVLVDDVDSVKWLVCAQQVSTPANKECSEVYAVHNGTAGADASATDYTEYAKIRTANISGYSIDVVLTGTGGTQTMGIQVTSTAAVDVQIVRLVYV